jgi:hypothetical protein
VAKYWRLTDTQPRRRCHVAAWAPGRQALPQEDTLPLRPHQTHLCSGSLCGKILALNRQTARLRDVDTVTLLPGHKAGKHSPKKTPLPPHICQPHTHL